MTCDCINKSINLALNVIKKITALLDFLNAIAELICGQWSTDTMLISRGKICYKIENILCCIKMLILFVNRVLFEKNREVF